MRLEKVEMKKKSVTLANGDGTGGAHRRQGQGIARPNVEIAAHGRAATPGKEERERDTARRAALLGSHFYTLA